MKLFSIATVALSLSFSAAQARMLTPDNKLVLPVQVIYESQLENESSEFQRAVLDVFGPISESVQKNALSGDAKAMKIYLTPNVSDEKYEVVLKNSNWGTYIPNRLFFALHESKACDLNITDGCVVFERDSISGKVVDRAYFVGSAPKDLVKDLNGLERSYRIVRVDVKDKSKAASIAKVLQGRRDGIYVYSQAPSREEAIAEYNATLYPNEVEEILNQESRENGEIAIARTPEEKSQAERVMQEIIDSTELSGTPSKRNRCYLKAEMRLVRRFFILDWLHTQKTPDGKIPLPTRISVPNEPGQPPTSQLICKLKDGTIQQPKIVLKDYQVFRVGFAFGKKHSHYLRAAGVGDINDVRDILGRKFGYASALKNAPGIGAQIQIPIKGFMINPIVISVAYKKGLYPIFAGAVSWSKSLLTPDLNVSLGGWYEIEIDLGDT